MNSIWAWLQNRFAGNSATVRAVPAVSNTVPAGNIFAGQPAGNIFSGQTQQINYTVPAIHGNISQGTTAPLRMLSADGNQVIG